METRSDLIEPYVTAVVVTYGDRGHLVNQVLERLSGVERLDVILVKNGPCSKSTSIRGTKINEVRLDQNLGSATGFSKGIDQALKGRGQYILLLDDYNIVGPEAISWLLSHAQIMARAKDASLCAVSAFRRGRFRLTPSGLGRAPEAAFLGFDLREVGGKLFSRVGFATKSRQRRKQSSSAWTNPLPYCAYGGLLAHRSLFERIGRPNEALVLHADDHAYTHRITALGGKIDLVRQAVIDDIDFGDERRKVPRKSGLVAQLVNRLKARPDFRLYYTIRNHVWLGADLNRDHGLAFHINALLYLALTTLAAAALGRWTNYRILIRAARDGFARRGGLRPEFPLPSAAT